MDSRQLALWQRLTEYQFDAPGTQLRFAHRLARENGWSVAYAERVLVEYKRFCYLALEAGHPVTPSEDVDQAWHLHMVYTRSYWGEFCPNVLGQPLHHGPTRGGTVEAVKHDDWYRRTLASHAKHFGGAPPADIWPDSATRFDHDIHWRRVNKQDYWLIRKPRLREVAGPLAFAFLMGLLGGCDGDPLNWNGHDFLWLFGLLFVVIVLVNLVVRNLLRGGHAEDTASLNAYEVGYLKGGKPRLLFTALADLVRRGHLQASESTLQPGTPLPADADSIDAQIVERIRTKGHRHATKPAQYDATTLHDSLAERDLVVARGTAWGIVLLNVLPLAALLIFGLCKVKVGLDLGKPVGYLVILCVVNLLVLLAFCVKPVYTRAGRRRLADVERQHAGLRIGESDFTPNNADAAIAVAIFGVAALQLGAHDQLRKLMQPMPGSGYAASGGGCSTSGCSSGDSGGGGGDGGGGGGCGGCGGGD